MLAVARIRRVQLLVGVVAAGGIAEQHYRPVGPIADLWAAETPIWSIMFAVAAVVCAVAVAQPRWSPHAGIFLASVLWLRSLALLSEFGADLWGTVAQIWLTSLLLVGSWSWRGTMVQALEDDDDR